MWTSIGKCRSPRERYPEQRPSRESVIDKETPAWGDGSRNRRAPDSPRGPSPPPRAPSELPAPPWSEALETAFATVGDVKKRVELGQLEQRLQVVVQVRQTQLAIDLADPLGERDQHAEPGTVDVAGLSEIDKELPFSTFQLLQH